MLLWDNTDPEDVQMLEKLRRGFDRMGCWRAELPPKDSIYKMVLTVEKENMEAVKNGKNKNQESACTQKLG
jgi:hypothetical protein